MKSNKNEELQSRRQFFKKAAKAALPILGTIVLANTPLIAKASGMGSSSCNSYCSNSCSGRCTSGCSTRCYGGCNTGCERSCKSDCSISCRASSNGYNSGCNDCKGYCWSGCKGTCSQNCNGSCRNTNYMSHVEHG
ncbi:MAG: Cys-Xaa-Xaa-Xaa repeat radical SAM target protein [Bacteroides sp.]|nr:Cys-Xaa-Xaa-Xaa repeat radical SAM target protein [Bacteroides sp.]